MKKLLTGMGLALFCATGASAATLNFNSFDHGDIVSTVTVMGVNGTVTADGNSVSSPDYAVAFDTTVRNTEDPDLEGPLFRSTNGASRNFGRALIIQENSGSRPDDDGMGGVITITFDSALTFLGFNVLDDATITVTSNRRDSKFAAVPGDNEWNNFNTNWDRITTLTFDFGEASGAIDNLRFGVASVPVPASPPLLAAAVGLLGWTRRKA